jgi:hypothetical protein
MKKDKRQDAKAAKTGRRRIIFFPENLFLAALASWRFSYGFCKPGR